MVLVLKQSEYWCYNNQSTSVKTNYSTSVKKN